MARKILYCFIIAFLFVSCLVTPPSTDSEKSVIQTNLRNIEIKCSESTHCLNSNSSFEVIALYTTDECNSIEVTSPVIGQAREKLICDEDGCTAYAKSFKKQGGVEDAIVTDSGYYTLAVFVDINNNEFPDKDEPFYCNADVDIFFTKRLTNIKVEINRKFDI
ncbi:MAG: hypothetical protein ACJAS4_002409 [Bacteriovoracaceae bacterium]|jgi:hypothetical protein